MNYIDVAVMIVRLPKKNRSIAQRIDRAKGKDAVREIAMDWAGTWQKEQESVVERLGKSISEDDFDAQCIAAGELKTITEKRFAGLRSMIERLTERIADGKSDT